MRVLVVEDGARMAGLLKRALQEEGHAVDVAADGPGGRPWFGRLWRDGRQQARRRRRGPAVPAGGVGLS